MPGTTTLMFYMVLYGISTLMYNLRCNKLEKEESFCSIEGTFSNFLFYCIICVLLGKLVLVNFSPKPLHPTALSFALFLDFFVGFVIVVVLDHLAR